MTLDEFVKKWTGKKCDFDGSFNSQCVDLYRFYVKEVLNFPQSPGVTGAKDIWDTYLQDFFIAIKNTPNGVPQKGDIIIWNKNAGGGYGHVAIFLEGNVNSFTSFDCNYPTGTLPHKQKHTYKNVIGWLRPIQGGDDMSDQDKKDIESMKKLREYNGVWYEAQDIIRDWEAQKKTLSGKDSAITTAQRERDEAYKKIEEKDVSISTLQELLPIIEKSRDNALAEVKKLKKLLSDKDKVIQEYIGKVADLETANRELKKGIPEALTLGDVLVLLFKKAFTMRL